MTISDTTTNSMDYLKVYKDGTLHSQTLSVPHLIASLEKSHVRIKEKPIQGNEIAHIRADKTSYIVYRDIQYTV